MTLMALIALPAARLAAQDDAPPERAPAEAERVVRALHVGTVHPISGPAINDGVILITDGRITAVGTADTVNIPDGAEVLRYPNGHAYPGLVDALSTAFGDASVLADGSADAGTEILDGLNPHDQMSRSLVSHGITTAYISNRGSGSWRGMGALVHPTADGFSPLASENSGAAAVQMRINGGASNTHPLARQKALRSVGNSFGQLEAYEKKKEDHAEALKKYEEEYAKYIEHFSEKSGEGEAEEGGDEAARESPRRSRSGGRRGRRGPPAREEEPKEEPSEKPKEEAAEKPAEKPPEKPADKPAEGDAAKKEGDKAPEKPKYPKAPTVSPAQEALISVRDGVRPLRVEARRADEILAALAMRREHDLPKMILEVAADAGDVAEQLAEAGIPVVTTDFLKPRGDDHQHNATLPGALADAGVAVAIGSGSVREARLLSLVAATASGHGLDPALAVSAITLTAAKSLGVGAEVGSLDAGKRGDVLVTDHPLLASDARILVVLSGGETQYEAPR